MTLSEVVAALSDLDDESTIIASQPWSSASRAAVISDAPDAVDQMARDGMVYFLEVAIARDLRDDWMSINSSADGFCERLIQYAMGDA
jgi:hypothetical protein